MDLPRGAAMRQGDRVDENTPDSLLPVSSHQSTLGLPVHPVQLNTCGTLSARFFLHPAAVFNSHRRGVDSSTLAFEQCLKVPGDLAFVASYQQDVVLGYRS